MSKAVQDPTAGYSDMPLNTRQTSAVSVIKMWNPVTQPHAKCVKMCVTIISNILYKTKEPKYRKIRLSNAKIQKFLVNIQGGIKLLKLSGFEQKEEINSINNLKEKILIIEEPSTIEEFEQLTDIWLVLLKTQFLWGINTKNNKNNKNKRFRIPNTIQNNMQNFFKTNKIAQSPQFQDLVQKSNNPQYSQTAKDRYNYFGSAIQLLLTNNNDFFADNSVHGLNDIDSSDIASMIITEILTGYYDEDDALMKIIYAEDLRILAEKQKEYEQLMLNQTMKSAANDNNVYNIAPAKTDNDNIIASKYKINDIVVLMFDNTEFKGSVRWIGLSHTFDSNYKGLWYGIELQSEYKNGHNGVWKQERYFGCPDKRGVYVKQLDIIRIVNDKTAVINDDDDDKANNNDNQSAVIANNDDNKTQLPVAVNNNDNKDNDNDNKDAIDNDIKDNKDDNKDNDDDIQLITQQNNAYIVVDIGCGWGNIGHCLMDNNYRPYFNEIATESELKNIDLYGVDISQEMINIAKKNNYIKYYKEIINMDCRKKELKQFADGSVDIIVSSNCIMKDKQIGHPDETFLIQVERLLKVDGWFVVTRRFHGVHLGLQLYAYLMIAQQLGFKQMFANRIREIFFIGWKKMKNPTI